MTALREGLLEGRAVGLTGGVPDQVRGALAALGARVADVAGDAERRTLDALVYDAALAFGAGGLAGLTEALDRCWRAIRDAIAIQMIPAGRPGKLVLVGPRPGAGPFADAARAALENLARTLSVEWARYGLTSVAIAPGERTNDEQLAELVCFLVSEAGDYFSGCRLELGALA